MEREWSPGYVVGNYLRIVRLLGRGGMGDVYLASAINGAGTFAVKTFQGPAVKQESDFYERFEREALAWINLDIHVNVVRAFAFNSYEARPFLVLEYVEGGDLERWLKTHRNRELGELVHLALQFCDGMIHALATGIQAHRDIKPSNCLLSDTGTLKVTDFGLSRVLMESSAAAPDHRQKSNDPHRDARLTQTGVLLGTLPYMAPEQFEDLKRVDARGDVYSFGVMFYEMVTGRLPFKASTGDWREWYLLHSRQPPPAVFGFNPFRNEPGRKELAELIQTCLAKDPRNRFHGFDQVRTRLAEIYPTLAGRRAPEAPTRRELSAEQWEDKGFNLLMLDRVNEALECFERSLKLDDTSPTAWAHKAGALIELGHYSDASTCCARAMELMTIDDSEVLTIAARMAAGTGDYNQALELAYRAVEANPRHTVAWEISGDIFNRFGMPESALDSAEKALTVDPGRDHAWAIKAEALRKLNRASDALEACDRSLEMRPESAYAWHTRGRILRDLGLQLQAVESQDRALQLKPAMAEAWYERGIALGALGEIADAGQSYLKALQHDPRHYRAMVNIGVDMLLTEEWQLALDAFDRALVIEPIDAIAWINRSQALLQLERCQEALESADRAIAVDSNRVQGWFLRAAALNKLERCLEALQAADRALELDPSQGLAWMAKGDALTGLNLAQDAFVCFQRAALLGVDRARKIVAEVATDKDVDGAANKRSTKRGKSIESQETKFEEMVAVAEQLIIKGKEQGYLTADDIRTGLPVIDAEPDQILRLFSAFREIGIEVTQGEK